MNSKHPFVDDDNDNDPTVQDPSIFARSPLSDRGHDDISDTSDSIAADFPRVSKGKPTPLPDSSDVYPLVGAADTVLNLMSGVKNTVEHPDPEELRRQVIQEVKTFRGRITRLGIDAETLDDASYVLCTAFDDVVVNNTAWGARSNWRRHSLLVTFHDDARGGKNVFTEARRLPKYLADPAANREVLELLYVCLALGFQGMYRDHPDRLETVREKIYNALCKVRTEPDPDLSPHWRGVSRKAGILTNFLPLWVVGALAGALVVAIFSSLFFSLHGKSTSVRNEMAKVKAPGLQVVGSLVTDDGTLQPEKQPLPSIVSTDLVTRLHTFLAPEVERKDVELISSEDGAVTIRILGADLFRSASDQLNIDKYRDLINRIASAIKQEPGRILVTGHTDNVPIKGNIRFPSNWELSEARAENVATLLRSRLPERRLKVKGMADREPLPEIDPNTKQGRARNRRIEITLQPDAS